MIVFASKDILEPADGLSNGDKLARVISEDLGNLERLREESLDLSRSSNLKLVLLRQLVHAQDSNDILQRLVVLQDLLNTSSNLVVLSSNNVGVHDTTGGIQGVHCRVNSTLSNGSKIDKCPYEINNWVFKLSPNVTMTFFAHLEFVP